MSENNSRMTERTAQQLGDSAETICGETSRRTVLSALGGAVAISGAGVAGATQESFTPIQQNFEELSIGSYPDGWEMDGAEDQQVVETHAADGSQSLQLVGGHGGCWEAIANAPFNSHPGEQPMRIAGSVKPAVEGEVGCHDSGSIYGKLRLRTAVGSWNSGQSRDLFGFGEGGIRGSGLDLGSFTQGEWVQYDIRYRYRSESDDVRVQYRIDGEQRGETTVDAIDTETSLSYLTFQSRDFTAYWDDLIVETVESFSVDAGTNTKTTTHRDSGGVSVFERFRDNALPLGLAGSGLFGGIGILAYRRLSTKETRLNEKDE